MGENHNYLIKDKVKIVIINGKEWIEKGDLTKALTFDDPEEIDNIYNKHKENFLDDMVLHHNEILFFSLLGSHLLAILSNTNQGAVFSKKILEYVNAQHDKENVNLIKYIVGKLAVRRTKNIAIMYFEDNKKASNIFMERINERFGLLHNNISEQKGKQIIDYSLSMSINDLFSKEIR